MKKKYLFVFLFFIMMGCSENVPCAEEFILPRDETNVSFTQKASDKDNVEQPNDYVELPSLDLPSTLPQTGEKQTIHWFYGVVFLLFALIGSHNQNVKLKE